MGRQRTWLTDEWQPSIVLKSLQLIRPVYRLEHVCKQNKCLKTNRLEKNSCLCYCRDMVSLKAFIESQFRPPMLHWQAAIDFLIAQPTVSADQDWRRTDVSCRLQKTG